MVIRGLIYVGWRSLVNFVYWRRARYGSFDFGGVRSVPLGHGEARRLVTEFFLNSVGLTTAVDGIPRGVWLSGVQRSWVRVARDAGFSCGLR